MPEPAEHSLIVAKPRGGAYFVERFLRMCPEVAESLRTVGAYVVVFAPAPDIEAMEDERTPTAESVAQRTRLALLEAERTLAPRPGAPLFIAEGTGCYFHLALLGEHAPLTGLRSSRGLFAGFVERGEGGASFFAPDGSEGGWDTARTLVMEWIAELGRNPTVGGS